MALAASLAVFVLSSACYQWAKFIAEGKKKGISGHVEEETDFSVVPEPMDKCYRETDFGSVKGRTF